MKKIWIASPVSHLFKNQQTAKEIISYSDCLETREYAGLEIFPKQYLFHCEININHEWSKQIRFYIKSKINSLPELQLISFHLATSCSAPILDGIMYQVGGKQYSEKEMLYHVATNLEWLRSFTGSELTIAVENNNYYPTAAYQIVTDGDFISNIVNGNQISFLFDLAHGEVTAVNKKVNYQAYCDSLPLEKAVQLHICRMAINEKGMAYDAHEFPEENIIERVKDLIDKYSIKYLTIEYYKEKSKLIEILKRFKNLFQ
jgi:uncharacterized protein (UPF0276 family)